MQPLGGQVAVVTGAGSGVGRATALRLAQDGAAVALVGRTRASLEETAALIAQRSSASAVAVILCDVTDSGAVEAAIRHITAILGPIDILVNNAAMNVAERQLSVLSVESWQSIVAAALNGAFYCTRAVLPAMRLRQNGIIVMISSEAGRWPAGRAGAAYSAAKAGLDALTGVINAEERMHSIRATTIQLGEINTPLIDRRPVVPPDEERRSRMLQPEDVAACVAFVAALPSHVALEEMVVRPTRMRTTL